MSVSISKASFEAAFPGVEFVDVAQPCMWMRAIKSEEEHALIREGTRICNVGARACMDAVREGVPEHEVAIASTNAMIREIGEPVFRLLN